MVVAAVSGGAGAVADAGEVTGQGATTLFRSTLLRQGLEGHKEISVLELRPSELPRLKGLDAIYLTAMGAERWGARPIRHKAQVLSTTPADAEKGLPKYVVAGGVFALAEPADPAFQVLVVVTSVLEAIKAFNLDGNEVICNIGFWADDLLIQDIDPIEAARVIRSAYENSR